jgi:hypothetical protein
MAHFPAQKKTNSQAIPFNRKKRKPATPTRLNHLVNLEFLSDVLILFGDI